MEEYAKDNMKMPIIEINDTSNLKNENQNYFYKLLNKNKSEGIIKLNKLTTNKITINYNLYIRTLLCLIILFYIIVDAPYRYDYYENRKEFYNALIKGKKYFENCMNGTLLKNITPPGSEAPDISVVIPIYNSEKYIKGVLRSIQNQNYSNIEIILINDLSPDNVTNVINEMQKEDERIILINNNINRGTLYSRCIGVLATKGKYIFTLDNDDLFFDETVFDELYNEATLGNFDIVEFKGLRHYDFHINIHHIDFTMYSNNHHNVHIIQPELSIYPRKQKDEYGVYDCFLWGKIIKTEKYKKTINIMGENVYSNKIIWGEDLITSYALFRTIDSFKFIGKIGIFRYVSPNTATYTTTNTQITSSLIIYLDLVHNMTSNTFEEKKYVSFLAVDCFKQSWKLPNLEDKHKKYLSSFLNRILKCEYILDDEKKRIRNFYAKKRKDGIILE